MVKEGQGQINQDFNDNVNNPNTELCFYCRTYKLKEDFNDEEGANICRACYGEYLILCKETEISFFEKEGRQATTLFLSSYFITDVYVILRGETYHISGYDPERKEYNYPDQERAEIFALKMQFLKSWGDFVVLYCHAGIDDPIKFVEWIKEKGDNFGESYNCELVKYENFWEFHGNLDKFSGAFSFRIYKKEYRDELAKKLSDPYFANIKT